MSGGFLRTHPETPRASAGRLSLLVGLLFAASATCFAAAPNPPVFDHDRGFYNSVFSLGLSSDAGTQIRYTLDGSAPTATAGTLYSGPISITTTSMVRAVAYVDSSNVSVSVTHTYIFLNDVIHQPLDIPTAGTTFANYPSGYLRETYDVGNGQSAVHDYQMDPAIVTSSAYSSEIIPSLTSITTMAITVNVADMFGPGGFYDDPDSHDSGATKPCSLEILYPSSPNKNLQINCAVEPHSHDRLKRSLRLTFSSTFG